MSALEDERAYALWTGRKTTSLRRPRLDCGHPNPGEVYYHALCDRLSCSDECAKAEHECAAYAGAKSSGGEEAPERAETVSPMLGVSRPTSSWLLFADVAAGPSVEGNPETVDLRRRVQDGTAPDPEAEAFRAEVLRQGLTECEIDGVRWIYGAGQWAVSPFQVEALRPGGHPRDWWVGRERVEELWREIDAEPEPCGICSGYGCPDCEAPADAVLEPEEQIEALRQQRAATYAEVDRLLAETETVLALIEMLPAPRLPWWKRWFR